MAAISFVIACNELKITQIVQINRLFQLLDLICADGDAFYGLTRMLMSRKIYTMSNEQRLAYNKVTIRIVRSYPEHKVIFVLLSLTIITPELQEGIFFLPD